MKKQMWKFIWFIVFSLFYCFFNNQLYAKTFSVDLENVLELEGVGLSAFVFGESMLKDDGVMESAEFDISLDDVEKVFLIWAGEVNYKNKDYNSVSIDVPAGNTYKVSADKVFTKNTGGILYSCIADITKIYKDKGTFTLKGIAYDKTKQNQSLSSCGYAVIVLYNEHRVKTSRLIKIKHGLLVLKPGELYQMPLLKKGSFLKLNVLSIVGGHGLKGNASCNILNNITITGKEDWDGSEGKYWDIDMFEIYDSDVLDIYSQGLTLTFDPLLQWIYPLAVVMEFENIGEGDV